MDAQEELEPVGVSTDAQPFAFIQVSWLADIWITRYKFNQVASLF